VPRRALTDCALLEHDRLWHHGVEKLSQHGFHTAVQDGERSWDVERCWHWLRSESWLRGGQKGKGSVRAVLVPLLLELPVEASCTRNELRRIPVDSGRRWLQECWQEVNKHSNGNP